MHAITHFSPHVGRVVGPEAAAVGPMLRHLFAMTLAPEDERTRFDGVATWIDAAGQRHLRIIRSRPDPAAPGGLRPYVALDRTIGG